MVARAAEAASATSISRPPPTRRRARPEGRAGRGALGPSRAAADRRHRARRAAQRRQVDAPRGAHRRDAQDRRLPVHDARAEPRRHGPRRRRPMPTAPDDRRRPRPHRGRERRGGTRARVPAPRRAHPGPRPGRRRLRARPEWDFEVIRDELRAHDPALLEKPTLVAFNKMDLPSAAEAWPAFQAARKRDGLRTVAISASTGEGIRRSGGRRGAPAGLGRARRAARAVGCRRPSPRRGARSRRACARVGGRLPRRGPADRAPRLADELRDRGIGGAVPARPRAPRRRRRAASSGIRPATRSASARWSWTGRPSPGARVGDGRAPSHDRAHGRHVRPDPRRPPGDRGGGPRRARRSIASCSCPPGCRRTSAPRGDPGRAPGRDGRARDRRQPGVRAQPDRGRSTRPVVHGRHGRGAGAASRRRPT